MKKIRKLTSLLLVLVMSLALAVPCFAAGPKDTVPSDVKKIGDTWTVGEYTFEYVEVEKAAPMPRDNYVVYGRHYTREHTENFVWSCCVNSTLKLTFDCSESRGDVLADITAGGKDCGTVLAYAHKTGGINVSRNGIPVDFANVSVHMYPVGELMDVTLYAYECND